MACSTEPASPFSMAAGMALRPAIALTGAAHQEIFRGELTTNFPKKWFIRRPSSRDRASFEVFVPRASRGSCSGCSAPVRAPRRSHIDFGFGPFQPLML